MNAVTPHPDTDNPASVNVLSQQPTASPTSDVVDLDGLVNRCMGNIELAQRVLEKFRQRFPEDLAELEAAYGLGDMEKVARTAHRIRGSSATMSAERLAEAATGVEHASRERRAADVSLCIERLRDEWRRLLDMPTDVLGGK